MGLENLTVNNCSSMAGTTCNTSSGSGQNITIGNCDQCYVKGVRSVFANRSHVRTLYSTRSQIQDNYTFENISHATVSYGIEIVGSNNLVVNNILQQNTDSEPSCSGPCEGNVIAYNFNIDNVYGAAGWMQAGFYEHSSGSAFNLWEGNIGPGYNADDVHGTHLFDTVLRNRLIGNQTAGCGGPGANTCTAQTTPVIIQAGDISTSLATCWVNLAFTTTTGATRRPRQHVPPSRPPSTRQVTRGMGASSRVRSTASVVNRPAPLMELSIRKWARR
jgi:hypothetical protein